MHERLWRLDLLLRATISLCMGERGLLQVRKLRAQAGHAAMCLHVLSGPAQGRVTWLRRQTTIRGRLLHSLWVRVRKGQMVGDTRGGPLLSHAMWHDLHRAALQALGILHHLLRVKAGVLLVRLRLRGHLRGVLAADTVHAVHAVLALLGMQSVPRQRKRRLRVHVRLCLVLRLGNAAHGDVLRHMLRGHMLLWRSRLPRVLRTTCRHMLLLGGPLVHGQPRDVGAILVVGSRVGCLLRHRHGHTGPLWHWTERPA